jgi:hypothetical protein
MVSRSQSKSNSFGRLVSTFPSFPSQELLFVRLEAPLFVPAHARCTRRAEIGSRRAAGPRAAAHSGLDAIEHGAEAEVRSGVVAAGSWLSAVCPHSATQTVATWRSGRPVLRVTASAVINFPEPAPALTSGSVADPSEPVGWAGLSNRRQATPGPPRRTPDRFQVGNRHPTPDS